MAMATICKIILLLIVIIIPQTPCSSSLTVAAQYLTCNNALTLKAETEGPYWVDLPAMETANIRGDVPYGVPLTLTLRAVNPRTCEGIGGVKIDLWHSRYDGEYSDEAVLGTYGQTWLRGYQFTNASGHATFYTFYPGWYPTRTTHIHMRVRLLDNGYTTYDATTQFYFDDFVSQDIFNNVYPYNNRLYPRDTYNYDDKLFVDSNLIIVNGSYEDIDGYHADVEFTLPFLS